MPDPISALVIGGSQLVSGMIASDSASDAAEAQINASDAGIAEQRRQFNAIQELLKPYVNAGTGSLAGLQPYASAGVPALEQQQALLGLRGQEAQQAAISGIESGAGFQAQVRQGEEALLQRAAATGGLRGGNMQAALAQFRPQMLQAEIENQYGRLGGLTALGQTTQQNIAQMGREAASNTASAGMRTGADIAGLLGQQGAARAGAEMERGRAMAGLFNMPAQFLGMQYGAKVAKPGSGSLFGP